MIFDEDVSEFLAKLVLTQKDDIDYKSLGGSKEDIVLLLSKEAIKRNNLIHERVIVNGNMGEPEYILSLLAGLVHSSAHLLVHEVTKSNKK